MIRVLFVCIHNSARSQMAEAWLRWLGGPRFHVESAGIEPGVLNPLVVKSLQESPGVDIHGKKTQSTDELLDAGKEYDYVITVCDAASADKCPFFPGKGHRLHWNFADPSRFQGTEAEKLAQIAVVREEIRAAVTAFLAGLPA